MNEVGRVQGFGWSPHEAVTSPAALSCQDRRQGGSIVASGRRATGCGQGRNCPLPPERSSAGREAPLEWKVDEPKRSKMMS